MPCGFQSLSGIRLLFHFTSVSCEHGNRNVFQSLSGIRLLFHDFGFSIDRLDPQGFNPSQGLGCFSTECVSTANGSCINVSIPLRD